MSTDNKYGSIHSGDDLARSLAEKKDEHDEPELSTFQQIRDICESLVVALFLAFLFKTFEAEAFVIPTGSMAPTLKGRHKDVVCDQCHFPFQTSASEEMDSSANRRNGRHVVAGTCPQCGYTQYFGDANPEARNDRVAPSFTGDRILVSKMTFDQREIRRFDVSVFRAPAEPKINFIKRIVGFPNENLRIQYGDLFSQPIDAASQANSTDDGDVSVDGSEWSPDVNLATAGDLLQPNPSSSVVDEQGDGSTPFVIARKGYDHLRQIMQLVYDADYSAETLDKLGWPTRWSDDWARAKSGRRGWSVARTKKGSVFTFTGAPVDDPDATSVAQIEPETEADVSPVDPEDATLAWLRYRHIVPSSGDWFYLEDGTLPPDVASTGVVANNPRLIDDFSAYNAGISRLAQYDQISGGLVWSDAPNDEFTLLTRRSSEKSGSERVFCMKNPDGFGCNWVGDLAISCDFTIQKTGSDEDRIVFDLVKGGVVFRCVVVPAKSTITLEIPGVPEFESTVANFSFKPGKKYHFEFFNVDEQMRVAVDNRELEFPGVGGRYDHLTTDTSETPASIPRNRDPNARDLAPVAVGARGVAVTLEGLKVLRDVYYIAAGRGLESWDSMHFTDFGTARCDRLTHERVYLGDEEDAARFMASPEMWTGYGNTKSALLRQGEGQYVALGDNSGFSLDSRLWSGPGVPHYVDRNYVIGKAFYVYWPHGKPLPLVGSPFLPDFSKMRHVD